MSILEDTANRRLRMQCSEICLAKSGTDPITAKGAGAVWTAKGAGAVWTDEAGQLRFECELSEADFAPYARAMERHVRQLPEEPGDDDYWQLTAVSTSGDIYRGRVLYAEDESRDEHRFPETSGKAKGKLHQLRSTRESEETGLDLVTLLVPRKIDFPRIWYPEGISSKDHCRIRLDNEQIELFEKQTYTTIVCALAPGGIATNRHWRMIEAIEFAFGQSIYPCAMETRNGAETVTALYSTVPGIEHEGPLAPPLDLRGPPVHHYPLTELVRKFYRYVLPYTEERPPLIAEGLWGMRQAADAQPDLRGLVFATTAETLIRACFPNIKPVDADWRRKVQALQRKIQEDGELDPTLRERAAGKLNALNELSNLEKIRQFLRWHVRDVEAQEEIFEQWKKLRNAAAHGAKTEQDFDQTERRIGVILDLCYAIVLTRIGFYGQWRISRQAHQKAWSIVPLSQSSSGALPLGATTVVSRFAWQPKKGGWARRVVVGQDPKAAILLVVQSKPQEGGAASFKINVAPKAVLPDGLARYQLAKSYTSWKDAAEVCDEIATRALVHLTVEHFS